MTDQLDRRELLEGAALSALLLSACQKAAQPQAGAGPAAAGHYPLGRALKAAFVNVGLANSWPSAGHWPAKPRLELI